MAVASLLVNLDKKSHSSWTPAILPEFQWWKKKEAFHSPPDKLAKGQRPLRNHATCWRTMSLSHKVRQTSPYSPLILSRHNLFPPSKCSNSFQLSCCCCHCYWLSIRHGVIKRVKEKLPWLCRSPDCTIRAVREVLYKGRARGRARWRLALPPW